jgi:hypothetical protein
VDDGEWYADPVVRLAAELMDPLHGVPVAPGPSAVELIAMAEETDDGQERQVRPTG